MLFSVFSDLNLGDSAQMMMALSEMAKGMSTALLTTLVGLISSVLLKFQLVIAQK
jgi:biopolymer transport protein ExbB/TolQ